MPVQLDMWPRNRVFRAVSSHDYGDGVTRTETQILTCRADATFCYVRRVATYDSFDGDTDHHETMAHGRWTCQGDTLTLEGEQSRSYHAYKHTSDEDATRKETPAAPFRAAWDRAALAAAPWTQAAAA